MSVSVQSAVVKLAGTPVPAEGASWEHGVSLRGGDVVGSSGSVRWAEGAVIPASQVAHPLRPGWSRTNGSACTVDVVKDGISTRVFTGQVQSSAGVFTDGSTSELTDWAKRLETPAHVPPVAFTMPGRPGITEEQVAVRRVGLWGTWITHLVMAKAGFNACQSVQSSSIWYQSMAGSAWTHPNPDHVIDTLGRLTTVHRLGNAAAAPAVTQGTHLPCMSEVYALGSTLPRRRSGSTSWQLTVDMASDAPTAGHTGRVDIRTLPQSVGAGVRLDWTQTQMRVYRRSTAGTLALLATAPRASGGVYSMRWSLVVRQDGTLSLHANDRLNAATASSHGIQLPSGPDPATVIVESEGPCSAVQVTRSDATSIVTQNVAARIHRSTFLERSLAAFDYVPPTPAIDILTEQADAERGLLGMPLWMWIDHNGHLVNADPAWLANQPAAHHFSTTSSGTPLDDVRWTRPPAGPYSRVDVVGRRGVTKVRTVPTILLHEGRQTNHDNGDALDEFLHPAQDQTWLDIDFYPYFAGQPLPAPGNQDLNRGIGSHVGGMVVTAANGERVGWVTPAQITGWSIDSSNHVRGALEVLDHRTVLYKGTVAVGSGYAMSSMPDQGSSGLWGHRAAQPLPQLRGRGRVDWHTHVESIVATGDATHPVLEHDTGMWCANAIWRGQIGEALAAASTNPVAELDLTVGLDPTVRVGQRVTAQVAYPDGAVLDVEGLVAGVSGSAPAPSDQMRVRLVLLSHTWTEAPAMGGATTGTDYEVIPPTMPRNTPPGTDPPNVSTDSRTVIEGVDASYWPGDPSDFGAYTAWWGFQHAPDLQADSSLWVDPAMFPASTTFRWDVTPSPSWEGVNGYLYVAHGNFDWMPGGFITPLQTKNIARMAVDIDWDFVGDEHSGLLAECWLTTTAHEWGELNDKTHEIAFFPRMSLSAKSWVTGLTQLGTYVSGGKTWSVAQGVSGAGNFPYLISYLADDSEHRGVLPYHDFFTFLHGKGKITGNEWMNGHAFGVEPHTGPGSLTIKKFAPVITAGPAGWLPGERIINGDFSAGATGWDGFGWGGKAVTGGAAVFTNVEAWSGVAALDVPLVGGKYYELKFTISGRTAGDLEPKLQKFGGGVTETTGTKRAANGTFTQRLLAVEGQNSLRLQPSVTTSLTLDNVSLTGPYETSTVGGS